MNLNAFLLAWVSFILVIAVIGRINIVLGVLAGAAVFCAIMFFSPRRG